MRTNQKSEMHLRVFSTNIMIVGQLSGHSEYASSKVWDGILKFCVTFECLIFLEMYLRNNLIKHGLA